MRLPILALIIFFVFALCVDSVIWFELRFLRRRWPRIVFGVITALCYLLLIGICVFPKRNAESGIVPIMWCLYTWLSIYVVKIFWMVFALVGLIPKLFHHKRITLGLYAGLPLGIVCFAAMWWGSAVTRRQIEVTRVEIVSDHVPAQFNGFTIAQISDLHVGTWGNDTTFVSALVDSINTLHPDMVVFTGDLVNRKTSEALPFESVLKRISAPYGVYSILGNHDYGDYISWSSEVEKQANLKAMHQLQSRASMLLLDNSHTFIRKGNDSIALIGVGNWGEPPFHIYGDLRLAYPEDARHSLKDSVFKVLLSHNPVHWDEEVVKISNIDLMLAGHTHAMQFAMKLGDWAWSPAAWKYKHWGGLFEGKSVAGTPAFLYVNIGDGEVGMPARIGASQPEITLITLKR